MARAGRTVKVDDVTLVELIRTHEDPIVTAPELADAVPLAANQINERLSVLEEQGIVRHKPCGSGIVWWVPE